MRRGQRSGRFCDPSLPPDFELVPSLSGPLGQVICRQHDPGSGPLEFKSQEEVQPRTLKRKNYSSVPYDSDEDTLVWIFPGPCVSRRVSPKTVTELRKFSDNKPF